MPGYPDKPLYEFRKGALWISAPREQMRMQPWPPQAHKRLWHNKWEPFAPEFKLVKPYRRRKRKKSPEDDPSQLQLGLGVEQNQPPPATPLGDKTRAFNAFRFALPKGLAAGIQDFRSHQWDLIRMTYLLGDPVRDLLKANGFIAYALANNATYRRMFLSEQTRPKALKVLGMKQKDILKCMKFPGTKAMVNLTRKIKRQSVHPDNVTALRRSVGDENVGRLLSHVSTVNAGVLELLTNPDLHTAFGPKLLHEVSETRKEDYYPFTARMLEEIQYMYRVARPRGKVPVFRSLKRIQECHDDLSQEFLRTSSRRLSHCRIPKPPIPGTDRIVPLTTLPQIKKEGEEQHNCVATYARRVAKRETYIYKVLGPTRSTLAIVKGPGGIWRRSELKAGGNLDVDAATRAAVDDWLAHYAVGAG